jgi:hypothetical protein
MARTSKPSSNLGGYRHVHVVTVEGGGSTGPTGPAGPGDPAGTGPTGASFTGGTGATGPTGVSFTGATGPTGPGGESELYSAAGAESTPLDTDVSGWPTPSTGIVTCTGGRVYLARKNAVDVYYVELIALVGE